MGLPAKALATIRILTPAHPLSRRVTGTGDSEKKGEKGKAEGRSREAEAEKASRTERRAAGLARTPLNFSSSKFGIHETRVAGVERREPPETRPTGGSLRSTPATPRSNLEPLNLARTRRCHLLIVDISPHSTELGLAPGVRLGRLRGSGPQPQPPQLWLPPGTGTGKLWWT
jgi:hypothetical protein